MLDGVEDVLSEIIKEGRDIYLLSACYQKNLEEDVKRYGLDLFFKKENVRGSSMDKARDIKEIISDYEKAVYIGDTSVDMECGKEAGIKTIGVLTGYHEREKLEPFADEIIEDLSGLFPLLGFNTLGSNQ